MKELKIEIKWAIIFVIVSLLWIALERIFGLHDENIDRHATFTNLFAIPAIVVYVFALLDKRRNYYRGVMSYKEGFISGLIITAFVTVLSPLIQYIVSEVVSPDYFSNAIKYVVSTGKMEQTAAEKYFNLNSYIIQSLIGTAIMGIITSAIVALFTRKRAK